MKQKKFSWIDIVLIILFLLAVYFISTRIFGHSASDLTISMTLFSLLGGLLYKLNREFGEFKVKTINSFDKMGSDFSLIKNKLKIK